MTRLTEQILEHAERLPEGAPIAAKALLHLGNRAALDQSLSRLARRGALFRIGRGLYVRPAKSRFGARPPAVEKIIESLAAAGGEILVPSGAAAANRLGLTTQVPVREVFLTSGPSRRFRLGRQTIEVRHAAPWQLVHAGHPSGEALRALAWAGPKGAEAALGRLRTLLSASTLAELKAAAPLLPTWLAKPIGAMTKHA